MPQYSVCICHTIFVLFWIISHVPACCLYGHRSRRRMSIGVFRLPRQLSGCTAGKMDQLCKWQINVNRRKRVSRH